MIKYLNRLFKSIFRSTEIIITSKLSIIDTKTEIRDQGWFNRKNNIIENFGYIPTPIYGSDLSTIIGVQLSDGTIKYRNKSEVIPLEVEYKGYVIRYFNSAELEYKKGLIEEGATSQFITLEEWNYLKTINSISNNTFIDDIELLKNDANFMKPIESKSTTASISEADIDVEECIKLYEEKRKEEIEDEDQGNTILPIESLDGRLLNEMRIYRDLYEDTRHVLYGNMEVNSEKDK